MADMNAKTISTFIDTHLTKLDKLDYLCGEILATLRLNIDNGQILFSGPVQKNAMEQLLVSWNRQYKELYQPRG